MGICQLFAKLKYAPNNTFNARVLNERTTPFKEATNQVHTGSQLAWHPITHNQPQTIHTISDTTNN